MFKPIKNVKVYEQIVEQIKNMIIDGSLKKGDRLPSERDLAELLQLSRASVREALIALEVIGLVESKQGAGNFIKDDFGNNLFEPMSIAFLLENGEIKDILEFRKVFELQIASLAAQKITDSELLELKEILEMLRNSDDEQTIISYDREFHARIAKSTKNPLIYNVFQANSQLFSDFIKEAQHIIVSNKENKEKLQKYHEDIFEALRKKDSKAAHKAMFEHFELVENCLSL